MRYIRTSDKIIENKMNMNFADRKQADTIEELCDEFVCKSKTSDFWQVSPHLNWEEYDLERYNFYGAIWADKGLIYVAKLNDKGELKLL